MLFFLAEEDWTLAITSRSSRIPLKKHFPALYVVNSLLSLGGRKVQHRKGPNYVGKTTQNNPNHILLPDKNRYGTKEPGELTDDGEEILSWLQEPIDFNPEYGNTDGDVIQQSKEWT